MEVLNNGDKPHVVCIPLPAQSHTKAMLKLAKLLHRKGFHITFVNTEYNHQRFLRVRGPNALDGLPRFRFETISDGLPLSDNTKPPQYPVSKNMIPPLLNLLATLNDTSTAAASLPGVAPPVTCIVSDGFMSFITIEAGEELGIPVVMFFTLSACGFMGFYQFRNLLEKGLTPLKDASYVTNGYLDTIIDWIPGMKDIRLKDLPSYIQTTEPNDKTFEFCMEAAERSSKASAIILHTFEALEQDLLNALASVFPFVYSIGPLQLLLNHISKNDESESVSVSIGYNLWKEESECLKWLDSKEPGSVIYVNFGSIVSLNQKQQEELGWGLVNSHHNFLWIIRPDLVKGTDESDSVFLPPELSAEIEERGLIVAWCPQEEVLNHPSVGGFVTHCGWNSTIESLTAGVPMICWPFFADQLTICRYACTEWEVGLDIGGDANREEVEKVVRELMGGEKGKEMKSKAMEWMGLAEKATCSDGSSTLNLNLLVKKLLDPMGG